MVNLKILSLNFEINYSFLFIIDELQNETVLWIFLRLSSSLAFCFSPGQSGQNTKSAGKSGSLIEETFELKLPDERTSTPSYRLALLKAGFLILLYGNGDSIRKFFSRLWMQS